jgi:hypothetical protein
MPINTASTILKYASVCPLQVESITVAVSTVTAGTLNVTVASKEVFGSAVTNGVATLPVSITAGWTASQVADAIRTKLNDASLTNLSALYTINGTSPSIVLTRKIASENDATLLVTIPASLGVTGGTSTNTTAGGTFTKLCDITSYPDMGSAPSKLDTTTLSETTYKTNILGLQEAPDLTFDANYDEAVYNTINGLTGDYFFQLDFGTADGKFNWQGQIRVYANGGGVDEVRMMTLVLSAETAITFNIIN